MSSTQLSCLSRRITDCDISDKSPAHKMSATDKKGPSSSEALLFFSILRNNKAKTEVDWDAVAREAGFKNASTAKVSPRPNMTV